METMMEYVTSMAKSADEAGRKAIIDGLRDLAISLETPWESMQRIMYLV
jgi:demethylsterigmatocystin 6-O-methyltransferase